MKSRRRKATPCPCENKCICHNTNSGIPDWMLIIAALAVIASIFAVATYIVYLNGETKRTIEVVGLDGIAQTCELTFKKTGMTSTGAVVGHDIVNLKYCR